MMEQPHRWPRFLLVDVISPHTHVSQAVIDLGELESLVLTFGGEVVGRVFQHRVKPDKATYIGSGKLEEVKRFVLSRGIDVVVLNDIVDSGQIFRLEKALWEVNPRINVWDRVDLILHIFDNHASSAEAKLQIELARLQHLGPRIYGLGRTLFSRQAGGIGTRGVGETNIELMKRYIKERIKRIRKKLKKITLDRKKKIERRKSNGVFTVALVGYTNAGKTTLFNALTGKNKTIANILFTTLDSCLGRMKNNGFFPKPVLISDTIGFIQDLPPSLIEAFQSTLMESVEADLLLHVVDASDKKMEQKIKVVEEILEDMSVAGEKSLLVFNKIDKISRLKREAIVKKYNSFPPVFISAKLGKGIEFLRQVVVERVLKFD